MVQVIWLPVAKLMENRFLAWVAAIAAAAAGYIFPDPATASAALAAAILLVLDTATGFLAALLTGRALQSRKFSRVLVKVFGYGAVLSVVAIVTKHVPGISGFQGAAATGTITLIIMTESLSVLENVSRMGINLPLGLTKMLKDRLGSHAAASTEVQQDE